MKDLEVVLMMMVLGSSVVLIIFILSHYNFRIKRAIAESGFNPNERKRRYNFMEIGCIALSLGLGFAICSILTGMDLPEDTFYFLVYATLFCCGGLGLMAAHFIGKRFD